MVELGAYVAQREINGSPDTRKIVKCKGFLKGRKEPRAFVRGMWVPSEGGNVIIGASTTAASLPMIKLSFSIRSM